MSDNSSQQEQQALKNAIFAAKAAHENAGNPQQAAAGAPSDDLISREQYVKTELGFDIPVDLIPLPSKGSVYPRSHGFHNCETVEFRGMTVREEDILTSQALIKKGTVINELIKACLIKKDVDVTSLLSGDRNAIMIAIRASGYGQMYNPAYTCPKCENVTNVDIDLAELEIKRLELQPTIPGENMFDFTLPRSGHTVTFRFLTGADEEEIISQMTARKKRGIQSSNLISTRLKTSIVAINGNRDKTAIARFSESMLALDSSTLRQYIDDHEPGINMSFEFTCENCEHYEEVAIPMDASFFWPNAAKQRKRNS
jgi:hypothetical protein